MARTDVEASASPDSAASLQFLRRYAPDGPWVLTAVQLDRKAIETRTFRPGQEAALMEWLGRYNGKRNCYFSVNPPLRDLSKKAEREDIKEMAWLHVDIDPRAGEDIAQEQSRALGLLTSNRPKNVPAPTVIIFSGGGYQAFWKLAQPVLINGNLELAENAKRYNKQLELLFGADNCHNIDRILRLPGTVNLPDAKKLKKGRTAATATVVEFDSERFYSIDEFVPALVVQMAVEHGLSTAGSGPEVRVSGNVERITDLSELDKWQVPDRVKVIIAQGRHPEESKLPKDDSRSAWLFDAVCNMIRSEVPDDVIYSILTDPDWGISESVLEKGGNSERYALKQIQAAKEHAIDPWLKTLNEKHAVISNIGGKCRIIEEVMDSGLNRTRLTRQSFDDFRNRYMNKVIQVGSTKDGTPIMTPVGAWWLKHTNRRQYDTILFAPNREIPGAYNLWRGYGCQSIPGECGLFVEHVRNNLCSGDDKLFTYVIGWMARAVQHPDTPGEVALVFRGSRGVGKGFFAKTFGRMFGRHYLAVSNSSHLVGNFNAHLRDVVLLFADEAFYAGDKKHKAILDTLITEEMITIEAKGVDIEQAPNYVHLMMASNEDHVIRARQKERRFCVLDVGSEQQQKSTYFAKIQRQLDDGGYEALLHFLLTYDISEYNVRAVPDTIALQDQKLFSLEVDEEWWYNKLEEGRLLASGEEDWPCDVRKEELIDDYINYTRRFNVTRRGNATSLGKFLARMCPSLTVVQRLTEWEEPTVQGFTRTIKGRAYFWQLPTLVDARAKWTEQFGTSQWNTHLVQKELDVAPKRAAF